ncbi:FkbM family methyltransferase, partial [Azospirillum isscasi]
MERSDIPKAPAGDPRPDLFHVHAIGSRGFGASFETSRAFADGVMFHNYEPDADANAQTDAFFAENGFLGRTHPVAVLDRDGTAELAVNYDPYTSSVLPPNPAYRDFYFPYPPPAGDYVFGAAAAPARRLEVPTLRLDRLSADTGLPVDWIAMDTQGTEFEILVGAERCCATTLVGFSSEVEFHPLYEGQKLFGDIAALAARHGFHLMRLTPHPAGSFRRAPLGWRGEGFLAAADAVFLRSVAAVRDGHPDPGLGLRKLAFASLCHGNVEHALDALEEAARFPAMPADAPPWCLFLDRLLDLHRAEDALFPVSFTDVYSLEDSLARFAPGCRDQNEDPARTARRFFAHTDRARFDAALPALLSARPTPFERLLAEHGLDGVAETVRRNRRTASFACARALGWFAKPGEPLAGA